MYIHINTAAEQIILNVSSRTKTRTHYFLRIFT